MAEIPKFGFGKILVSVVHYLIHKVFKLLLWLVVELSVGFNVEIVKPSYLHVSAVY